MIETLAHLSPAFDVRPEMDIADAWDPFHRTKRIGERGDLGAGDPVSQSQQNSMDDLLVQFTHLPR